MGRLVLLRSNGDFFADVGALVRKIPKGKVTTYGRLAALLGTKDARKVGWALHGNTDPKTPCHRVVNKNGRIAPNYAFGGDGEQRRKLIEEGVVFIDSARVDLSKSLWEPR